MSKGLGLYECEVTGDERGDTRQLVAVSKFKDNLITHCKFKYDANISELNSLGCPVPSTYNTYYIIKEVDIAIV